MIAVVLDSNIYISALVFGGNPLRIIRLAELGVIEPYVSTEIQAEVERVLIGKFHWQPTRVTAAAKYVWTLTLCIEPTRRVDDCIDPDDNRVLECASEAGASWIITGDQHLLDLNPYGSIAIATPRQFLDSKVWEGKE